MPCRCAPRLLALTLPALTLLAACSPTEEARETAALIAAHTVTKLPAGLIAIDARFGDALALQGYLLDPRDLTQQAGDRLTLTLVWRCDRRPPPGYRFFTHLSDSRGRLLRNLDAAGPVRQQADDGRPLAPPWRCKPGSYLLDPVEVPIPTDAPPMIQLRVGLYRGEQRLPAVGGGSDGRGAAVIKLSVRGGDRLADAGAWPARAPTWGAQHAPRGARPTRPTSGPQVPELKVPHLPPGDTPTIDGVLDEPLWRGAAQTASFVHAGHGRAMRGPPYGRVKIIYDSRYLYLGFEVVDETITGGFPGDAVDPQLWTRDTVEVMIDPDGDGDNIDYYEVQINPQNLVFDSHFEGYNLPRGGPSGPFGNQQWASQLRSAVTVNGTLDDDGDRDQGYVVEVALPWRAFHKAKQVPPQPGDSWRMNFYAMQNNGGAAWSPILGRGNFHRASRFGRVVFLAP